MIVAALQGGFFAVWSALAFFACMALGRAGEDGIAWVFFWASVALFITSIPVFFEGVRHAWIREAALRISLSGTHTDAAIRRARELWESKNGLD